MATTSADVQHRTDRHTHGRLSSRGDGRQSHGARAVQCKKPGRCWRPPGRPVCWSSISSSTSGPSYPEISDRNVIFRERKTSARVPPADPVSLIIPEVQPLPHEPVVVKHRVNAFFGTDLEMILGA